MIFPFKGNALFFQILPPLRGWFGGLDVTPTGLQLWDYYFSIILSPLRGWFDEPSFLYHRATPPGLDWWISMSPLRGYSCGG